MKDYKIRVANEAESKEAQELFFELGYKWFASGAKVMLLRDSSFISAHNNGDLSASRFGNPEKKEITLQQLKDLVVLKRNDVCDATHTDQDDWKWYIGANSYVWQAGNSQQLKQWDKSSLDMVNLKPIEPKMSIFDTGRHVVKEYLDPDNGYVLITADEEIKGCSNWIEVPNGADFYIELTSKINGFYKDNFKFTHHGGAWHKTEAGSDYCWINHPVLWQRNKQAGELPITDFEPDFEELENLLIETTKHKPSINDQYAEIEQVRQDNVNHPPHYSSGEIECIDAIQSSMTHEAFCGYLKGNVQKYMWRYESKGGTESLKKAQWYLNKLIEVKDETSSKD